MVELRPVNEGSTKPVPISFFDSADVALVPTSVSWSLYDERGAVVNGRENVTAAPASSIVIVLTGADHAADSPAAKRHLVVEAIYDSTYGTGLPLVEEFEYPVIPIMGKV